VGAGAGAREKDRPGGLETTVLVSVLLGATLGVVYWIWSAFIAFFGSEGLVPPDWRLPDVPDGAQVQSASKECASGGCWRVIELRPPAGQSPGELAVEMGMGEPGEWGRHVFDPAPVWHDAVTHAEVLRVSFGYSDVAY